jgi:DNA primase catalytic subunit
MDLIHFVRDPDYVAGLMKARYPKRHHPACDRKGQNDCDCHTYSSGALTLRAIKESFKKSAEMSPLYRKKRKLEFRLRVKKIRQYYNSITEAELWLPADAGFRQFRFFIWDDKKEQVIVRVIKDNFRHKSTLLNWLRRLAPLHVYYTTSAWLNPQGIGPDPKGKHGKSKMKKRNRSMKMAQYYDTMLYQGLYFDVDYDNADYNEGASMLMRLRDSLPIAIDRITADEEAVDERIYLEGLSGEPLMIFSGGKGFHLIQQEWSSTGFATGSTERYRELAPVNQEWSKQSKDLICKTLRDVDPTLLLDWEVTRDPRRIIRLPGTVHGKTLRVCKIVTDEDFEFSDGKWTYLADSPIG